MLSGAIEVRLIGVVALLFSFWALRMIQPKTDDLPGGYQSAVLALELVKDKSDLKKIVSIKAATDLIQKQLGQDTLFILLYVVLFGALGVFVSRFPSGALAITGWIATALIVVAGLLDFVENRGMAKAINIAHENLTDALASSIRYSSLGKWGVFYLSILLVGVSLLWGGKLLLIPGLSFIVAALLGISGVVANLIEPKFYPMFPWAIGTMTPGVLFVSFVFTFAPWLVAPE